MSRSTHYGERGVTLMELLIAVMLLSLLTVGMLFAVRVGLSSMERTNTYFTNTRRVLGVDRIVTEQIAGYMPVKGICGAGAAGPGAQIAFFQGDLQTMRFVTTYSLNEAARGYPRILEYQVIPGENGAGVRLIVNELLYTGPLSTMSLCAGMVADPMSGVPVMSWRPVAIGPQSFVLADKLSRCQFSYKEETDPGKPDIWYPRWPREFTPAAIRIDWAPLNADPSRLQLPPVTVPLRSNADPRKEYADL